MFAPPPTAPLPAGSSGLYGDVYPHSRRPSCNVDAAQGTVSSSPAARSLRSEWRGPKRTRVAGSGAVSPRHSCNATPPSRSPATSIPATPPAATTSRRWTPGAGRSPQNWALSDALGLEVDCRLAHAQLARRREQPCRSSALMVLEPSFEKPSTRKSQEFELISSTLDGRLNYVVGACYFQGKQPMCATSSR